MISEIAARLGQIQIANGYHTDAGLNEVFDDYESIEPEKVNLPALLVFEQENQSKSRNGFSNNYTAETTFVIEGVTSFEGTKAREAAALLKEDICNAVFGGEDRKKDAFMRVSYLGDRTLPREPGSKVITVQVRGRFDKKITFKQPAQLV